MIDLTIPGFGRLQLTHLVLDYNGTLAADGGLLAGVPDRLQRLAADLELVIVTADTFGTVRQACADLPVHIRVLAADGQQDVAKLDLISDIGPDRVVAIGNGRNDRLMLATAALGVAVVQQEGVSAVTLAVADVVVTDIRDGLDLLAFPDRLKATLRS